MLDVVTAQLRDGFASLDPAATHQDPAPIEEDGADQDPAEPCGQTVPALIRPGRRPAGHFTPMRWSADMTSARTLELTEKPA
jgi:hypothetical protein